MGETTEQTAEIAIHQVVLELEEPVPSEVPVGSDIVLKVKVSCPRGCDVDGRLVNIVADEETLTACVHEEIAVNVPRTLGACAWTLLFPRQEIGGIVHERASLSITFVTTPLATSLAIWDVPSPVVVGERFAVKVGAKSSGACALRGATVELMDDAGTIVGCGHLGDVPWEGTTALYWTEVELPAPSNEGIVSWSARFAKAHTEVPHAEATAGFSFFVVRCPDHQITITFIEKDTAKPIEHAHIRLGPFRAQTDAGGVAQLSLPKGTYEIKVWHVGYEAPPTTVDVFDDVTLRLVGVAVPEEDPSARFMM